MKITINLSLAVALSILLFSCKEDVKQDQKPKTEHVAVPVDEVHLTAAQIKNAGIALGNAAKKPIHATIKVNGVVDVPPENIFSVSVPMGGYVSKMAIMPGMFVNKGSVLALVEDQQYIQLQQDYLTAKNKLKFYEADYIRQKGLNQTKATSDKIFQQTESEFNNQKVMIGALAEKLRLISINPAGLNERNISRTIRVYAPISGYVSKVNINTGKYVAAADVLFEVINPKALHVSLTVFEGDAANLKIGQKILCSTSSNPDKKYAATIHLITPNIENDRTTSVHCDLENFDKGLLPGTFLNAEIQSSQNDALAVPDDAIVKWENKFYVFSSVGADQFKMVNITPGLSLDGFTAITSNQELGKIVVKNAYAVLMKLKNSGEE